MTIPWHDWQFYVTTLLFLLAMAMLLRPLVGRKSGNGCGGCSVGNTPSAPESQGRGR